MSARMQVDAAAQMIEDLLVPTDEARNEHKRLQLRELAALNGTLKDDQHCYLCGQSGHRQFECPTHSQEIFQLPDQIKSAADEQYQRDVARMAGERAVPVSWSAGWGSHACMPGPVNAPMCLQLRYEAMRACGACYVTHEHGTATVESQALQVAIRHCQMALHHVFPMHALGCNPRIAYVSIAEACIPPAHPVSAELHGCAHAGPAGRRVQVLHGRAGRRSPASLRTLRGWLWREVQAWPGQCASIWGRWAQVPSWG